jgi:crotonobetainyl-CoA:carnitine CoA-transferase CaiB-like acyl-CoA transferase
VFLPIIPPPKSAFLRIAEDPGSIRGLPLRLDEDTQKVFEQPGFSGEEIHELADEGII